MLLALTEKRSVKAGAIGLAVLMSLLYVVQINVTATKGYEIRDLESHLADLQHQSALLRLQSLELQSIDRLQKQMQDHQGEFVASRVDAFITPSSTAVAAAK